MKTYSCFLLLFNWPALLVTTTERLAQKLCMSHKVIIHIAKFIHCLCVWILYIYNFFPFKNWGKTVNICMFKIGLRVRYECLLVLFCTTKAHCHPLSILHSNNSQSFFLACLFMWFCVCYIQKYHKKKVAGFSSCSLCWLLLSMFWISSYKFWISTEVVILVVITASCHWRWWWCSPDPWPWVPILSHVSVQALGKLHCLGNSISDSKQAAQVFSFPEMTYCYCGPLHWLATEAAKCQCQHMGKQLEQDCPGTPAEPNHIFQQPRAWESQEDHGSHYAHLLGHALACQAPHLGWLAAAWGQARPGFPSHGGQNGGDTADMWLRLSPKGS